MSLRSQLLLFLLPAFIVISSITLFWLPYSQTFFGRVLLIALNTSFMAGFLYFVAYKIAEPIRALSKSSLSIAAGNYGESVPVAGPKEIQELSNTLNTLSECLAEQINRLKENSLLRERMYGEYECSMLLQHLMLQKNIDECESDLVAATSVTLYSNAPRGLLANFPKTEPHLFSIHIAEAKEEGLEGIYELLTEYKLTKNPRLQLEFDAQRSTLRYQGNHAPLIWSAYKKLLIDPQAKRTIELESGDFFFIYNEGLLSFMTHRKALSDFLSKVLKLFAPEGLETATKMLRKELSLTTKKRKLETDLHLLCFQIL